MIMYRLSNIVFKKQSASSYIMDEFEKPNLSPKEKGVLKKVQSEIAYCIYCQPYDSGEAVWIFGDKVDLDDLIFKYTDSEKTIKKIKIHLYCPHCGHDNFTWDEEIGVKTEYENKADELMEEVAILHGTDLKDLKELIDKNPLLVYKNPLAQNIFQEIESKKFPIINISGKFYRARKVEDSKILNSDELKCPPIGKSNEGRFNHAGQSHLYLANNKETAVMEISEGHNSSLLWYQEFDIEEKVDKILDLSYSFGDISLSSSVLFLALTKYGDAIYKEGGNIENWRPDYFLTRYIMDCAKHCGYNGIKYNSTKDALGYNYVLFFPEVVKSQAIDRPQVYIFMKKEDDDIFNSPSEFWNNI